MKASTRQLSNSFSALEDSSSPLPEAVLADSSNRNCRSSAVGEGRLDPSIWDDAPPWAKALFDVLLVRLNSLETRTSTVENQLTQAGNMFHEMTKKQQQLEADLATLAIKVEAATAAAAAMVASSSAPSYTPPPPPPPLAGRKVDPQYKLAFKVDGLLEQKTGKELAVQIEKRVFDSMGAVIHVVEAYPLPGKRGAPALVAGPAVTDNRPRRVLFRVSNVWEAESIVRSRYKLKGSGVTILDELSPEEYAVHQRLWPLFKAARDEGKKAYFNRAKLFVGGAEVIP